MASSVKAGTEAGDGAVVDLGLMVSNLAVEFGLSPEFGGLYPKSGVSGIKPPIFGALGVSAVAAGISGTGAGAARVAEASGAGSDTGIGVVAFLAFFARGFRGGLEAELAAEGAFFALMV